MALDRLLVLATLVGMDSVQRIADPFQHLIVEMQPAQEFGELILKHSSRTYLHRHAAGLPWHLLA